jgi:outer membrane receptor protein involved in Fe transport
MQSRRKLVRSLLLASAMVCSPAWAQNAGTAGEAETEQARPANEDIVVTARRRDERLQDVPVAISVLSGAQLEKSSTSNFESVGTQIPQVMFTKGISGTGAVVTIRGVGSNTSSDDSIEQTVSFNIDGVSSARGRLISQALFDLSDIQVLKGPQALYFGKNSPGGVIVVRSRDPSDSLDGYVTAGYEFRAHEYRVEGALGGPITDNLGLRVALFHSDMTQGYIRNVAPPVAAANSPIPYDEANGIDAPGGSYKWGPGSLQTAGRLTLLYQPGDDFSARLKITAADYKDNGDTASIVHTSCPQGFNNPNLIDLGGILFTGAPAFVLDPNVGCSRTRNQSQGALALALAQTSPDYGNGKPYLHTRSYLSSLELNYSVGSLQLNSITGFYKGESTALNIYDYTTFALVPSFLKTDQTSWSQEFRVSSQFDGPLNYVIGGFYSNDKKRIRNTVSLMRVVDPVSGDLAQFISEIVADGHSYSGVGEIIWEVTPEIEFDAGVRYTNETKSADLRSVYVQAGLPTILQLALPQGQSISVSVNQDRLLPQATLTWRPSREVSLFAAFRTGTKSGGPTNPQLIPFTATAANQQYKAETASGFEGGLKLNALRGQLTGDLIIYSYNYKNLQVASFDSNLNASFIRNAGSAKTTGIEGSLNYQVSEFLGLRGAFGFNRARFGAFDNIQCWSGQTAAQGCDANGNQDLTGRPLPRAPDFSGTAGLTFSQPLNSTTTAEFTIDGRYTSSYYTSAQLSPYALQKGYGLVDATIRVTGGDDRWDLSLITKNIFDQYYTTFTADTLLNVAQGGQSGLLGLPRTVTLQFRYNFR